VDAGGVFRGRRMEQSMRGGEHVAVPVALEWAWRAEEQG
jgi:hypothetical protein